MKLRKNLRLIIIIIKTSRLIQCRVEWQNKQHRHNMATPLPPPELSKRKHFKLHKIDTTENSKLFIKHKQTATETSRHTQTNKQTHTQKTNYSHDIKYF